MELTAYKRILVTGGAGFIGSALVRRLVSLGARVTVVDNLVNGKSANLDGTPPDRVHLEIVDVRDEDNMKRLLRDVEIVFHLACLGVRHSIHSPSENHDVNATATLSLLRLARESRVSRFVYVSSSEVYGTACHAPIDEMHPTFPHTVYGGSKLAGECYTRAFWKTYGYPTVVVRPFNTYGPRSHHEGDSGEVIPKFMLRALAGRNLIVFGDGSQTRDFTFVDDTARGIADVGFSDAAVGETLNIGYGEEITIGSLAREVIDVVGNPSVSVEHVESRPGDVLRLLADGRKAERLVHFAPRTSLRSGLEKLLAWYRDQAADPDTLLELEEIRNWNRMDYRAQNA